MKAIHSIRHRPTPTKTDFFSFECTKVDFILGDHEIAIEVKSTETANPNHLKGLRRFKEEFSIRRSILVSLALKPRKTEDQIKILPPGRPF